MKSVVINNNEYVFVKDYRDNEKLRSSFNKLAIETFGINFETWYQSGYWKDRYNPYSIVDNNEVVANVSINIINFNVLGENKLYIQLGTVMTKKEYRHKGLSRFLIETIIDEWKNKCDNIYLFANDTVLDFYPKFGFKSEDEYIYYKDVSIKNNNLIYKKLDMKAKENRNFVYNKIISSIPQAQLFMENNADLDMFYCISFMSENIYYIEKYDAVVVIEEDNDELYIHDIWSEAEVNIDDIINCLGKEKINKVILGFTPKDTSSYNVKLFKEEGTTLFMLKEHEVFKNNKIKFEMLSQA